MSRSILSLVVGSALALTGFAVWASQPNKVADFMRIKLAKSQSLLEGLALEDFDAIAKNAQALSLLCEEETWRVIQTPEYLAHSEHFRRTANAVAKAAQEKNLDGAALGYVGLTMQCVECHKYVRDVRRAELDGDLNLAPPVRMASR
jgi:hypothetical protein